MRARRPLLILAGAAAVAMLVANIAVIRGGRVTHTARAPEGRAGQEAYFSAQADCALVLGAGVHDDGTPSDVLRDRLDQALDLYRSGQVKRILVSGDHQSVAYDEPNAMRRYLEANGVPAEAVFMDHAGFDTYSSIWRARHVFGARRVVVVTQRFHLARAVWCARAMGMDADGSAADRRRYRGIVWLEAREIISRTKALLDVSVHRVPRHGGGPIDLAGDGRVTAG